MSRVLTIGIATALAAGAVLAASPAHATTPVARNHVVALAGSDGYLIYEVAKASKSIRPGARNRGTLYARDAAGKVSRLTHFVDGKGVIEQTGHSLVEQTFTTVTIGGVLSGVQEVRQRDLRTGAERVVTLDPDDSMASVAPDGYVERYDKGDGDGMSDAGTTTLTYHHIDGSTADIAIPFADHTTYRLQASDQGLLAMTPPSDEQLRPSRIAYMTWADPGVWHPIYSPGKRREIYCATPSSTHVACRVDGIDAGGPGLVLLRLQDGHATWLRRTHPKACAYASWTTRGTDLYALETSDAGACTKGKLYRLHDDGTLVGGGTRYLFSPLGGIDTAYGKAVLSGGDQRHLYTTTGVTRRPVVIAKA